MLPPPAEEMRVLGEIGIRQSGQSGRDGKPANAGGRGGLENESEPPLDPSQTEVQQLLAVSRDAWSLALENVPDAQLRYRAALRQLLFHLQKEKWSALNTSRDSAEGQPMESIRSGRSGSSSEGVRLVLDEPHLLDPRLAKELVPTDQIELRGLPKEVRREGLGLPLVAWLPADSSYLRNEPGVPQQGMALPVTAVLSFSSRGEAELRFVRTLERDTLRLRKREVPLAKNYSAAVAWMIKNGANRHLNLVGLFAPKQHFGTSGLFQLQPFDADKIPVVFVHGLLSHPVTWQPALLAALEDPQIRERYQFWFFSYPTGLPVWVSAARLRGELDRYQSELSARARTTAQKRNLQEKILVGHSMGGLLSSLQVREGGNYLWEQFSDTRFEDLPLPQRAKESLQETLFFSARSDIRRVLFVAVPHRGSPMALRPAARFLAARVAYVLPEIADVRDSLLIHARHSLRRELTPPSNSLRFLRFNSPLLLSILQLPLRPGVELHSILGDRGRGDGVAGSDGVVPGVSAHLAEAKSEKIVPSGHDAHTHPEGVAEILRILREER